jgi:hypothetical protein
LDFQIYENVISNRVKWFFWQRAADILPMIRQAQKAGATTLQAVAEAMTARGISTPGGRGAWHPITVKRAMKYAAAA